MTFELDQYLQGNSAMTLQLKLLKYGRAYHVRSTAHIVPAGFFPYLAPMIPSISSSAQGEDHGCSGPGYLHQQLITRYSLDVSVLFTLHIERNKLHIWGLDYTLHIKNSRLHI